MRPRRRSRSWTSIVAALVIVGAFGAGFAIGNDEAPRPSVFHAAELDVTSMEEGPSGFTTVGQISMFVARTEDEGRELWRTDGTRGGTRLVRDILPGAGSSDPLGVALGDLYIFGARDGRHGHELWRSDGTRRGTRLLVDIRPGKPGQDLWSFSEETGDGRVYFTANDGRHGEELWVTDGTRTGTHLVRDIDRTARESIDYHDQPRELVVIGDRVFFAGSDGRHGVELWVSDGTQRGTRMVVDIRPGAASRTPRTRVSWLTAADRHVFFLVNDGLHGLELWVSDGTVAGTRMTRDIRHGPRSPRFDQVVALGDRVLFSASEPGSGAEPWVSDGTAEGTGRLADIADGDRNSLPYGFTVVEDQAVFTAHDGDKRAELWITDGTHAGTRRVVEFPSDTPCGMAPIAAIGGIALLEGCTLWETDGTEDGTLKVSGSPSPAREYGVLGHVLLFRNESRSGRASLWAARPITDTGR